MFARYKLIPIELNTKKNNLSVKSKMMRCIFDILFLYNYRYITDRVFNNNVTICQAQTREKHMFTSNGHVIDILVITPVADPGNGFILNYGGMQIYFT